MTLVDLMLIAITPGEANESGYKADVEHPLTVVAERMSVNRSEFYEALKAGIKPTAIFRLHPLDYSGQVLAECEGVRYEVIRTYEDSPDVIELTCAKVV